MADTTNAHGIWDTLARGAMDGAWVPFLGAGVSLRYQTEGQPDFRPTVDWLTPRLWALFDRKEPKNAREIEARPADAGHQGDDTGRMIAWHGARPSSEEGTSPKQMVNDHKVVHALKAQLASPSGGFRRGSRTSGSALAAACSAAERPGRAREHTERWLRDHRRDWNELADRGRTAAAAQGSADHRAAHRSHLHLLHEAIDGLLGRVGMKDTSGVIEPLQQAANQILVRYETFPPAGAGGPIEVHASSHADRPQLGVTHARAAARGIEPLSTGQRQQLGLAWMLAQHQLPQASNGAEWLGHRCLMLDDAGSPQDEDALAHESLVLRQLAYGADEDHQLQLILFTHHRRTADRHCELLAPPAGAGPSYVELPRPGTDHPRPHDVRIPATGKSAGAALEHDITDALTRALTFGRPTETL